MSQGVRLTPRKASKLLRFCGKDRNIPEIFLPLEALLFLLSSHSLPGKNPPAFLFGTKSTRAGRFKCRSKLGWAKLSRFFGRFTVRACGGCIHRCERWCFQFKLHPNLWWINFPRSIPTPKMNECPQKGTIFKGNFIFHAQLFRGHASFFWGVSVIKMFVSPKDQAKRGGWNFTKARSRQT